MGEKDSTDRRRNEKNKVGAPFNAQGCRNFVLRLGALYIRHALKYPAFEELSSYVEVTSRLHYFFGGTEDETNSAMIYALSTKTGEL